MTIDEDLAAAAGPHEKSESDRTLIRKLQSGEPDAATQIFLRYANRLQRLARAQSGSGLRVRFDAEDVVQSVFRTFFRRVALGHYQVPEGEELWKLLLIIALHKIRSLGEHHRAAKRDVDRTGRLDKGEEVPGEAARYDAFSHEVLKMTIDDVVRDLPEGHQRMVLMRIDGHDLDVIAATVGRAKRTVERVLHDFRERLKAALSDD